MAYQNRRYTGDFLTIQQLISEGRLGEVKTFEAHYDRCVPRAQSFLIGLENLANHFAGPVTYTPDIIIAIVLW
jgi:predicted dehydrogenase